MKIYTPKEVADELRCNRETVNRLLRNRTIKGFKIGNRWRIRDDELMRLQDEGKDK